ncbi:MAG: hypothetical protein E7174_02095 [Firmicutes bacterium]|nr:hypothetical protein [Bacillota bacterium]
MITNEFINECKRGANHNRLGYLNISESNLSYSEKNNLKSFSIDSGCFVDGNIIGSIYISKLSGELINIEDINLLLQKEINASVGIMFDNNTTEYIDLGNFIIEHPNDLKTQNKVEFTAYQKIINTIDNKYNCYLDFENTPVTLKDLYLDVCQQLDLIPKSEEFLNSDIPLSNNPFTNNETNRIVLQSLANVSCSYIKIDSLSNQIELAWFDYESEPKYTFYPTDYSTLEGGKLGFGPVNNLVLKNSQINDENVSKSNDESIDLYGENSIVINDDYVLYNSELREIAIENIFNKVLGFKYVECKLISYYGKPFLNIGDKIRVYIDDTNYFDTYILKHNFKYDGTFESTLESPILTKEEINQKQDISLGQLLRDTQIKVNKQEGIIESITTNIKQVSDLAGNIYTKEETNKLIQEAETGITNTFIKSGGNNIFRNTGLWYKNDNSDKEQNPYEFWIGNVERKQDNKSSSKNVMLIQKGIFEQDVEVSNGDYTVSFKYKKLLDLATVKVVINDVEYELTEKYDTEFFTGKTDDDGIYIINPLEVRANNIKVSFISDTDDSLEVWDLMVNKGTEKVVWTQNQNETTTDTVNISKGITITSSEMEVQFKANANGIKTLNKTGTETLTEFTDKGMTTNEATIKNEATIVGILRQRVENQVWDSFIG